MRVFQSGMHFPALCDVLKGELLRSRQVDVGEWHGVKTDGNPLLVTMEVPFLTFEIHVPTKLDHLQTLIDPNLPWAEDHFLERVSGQPLNPAPSHNWWPWNHSQHQDTDEKFSHTYPERFWPKHAGGIEGISQPPLGGNQGIRFKYGDLSDVVQLLKANSMTRQAYLPVWFPEDTGGTHRIGGRVPCSMGYHFMRRGDELHCVYTMRSCDFVRHFRDDIYMAARLLQWMVDQLGKQGAYALIPGKLMVHISSLHAMEGDRPKMEGRT